MFFTVLILLTIGIAGRFGYKFYRGADLEDNIAESIVSFVVAALMAFIVEGASHYDLVLWVLVVAIGLLIKRSIEWLNKWHENHL